jgi:hypothetical protein
MLRSLTASVAILLLAGTALAGEPAPLALHPKNPRYFLFRGEPAVLVTSGEHYGAVLNLDFDYVRYLDTLAADGLNHTRTFSGVYREVAGSFGITENTLAPRPDRYAAPWARSDTPGALDGENRFDLETWNEAYFERLKGFVAEASERGIVVELVLFCPLYEEEMWTVSPLNAPNNVNGVGAVGRDEVYTLAHGDLTAVQERLARKIVTELNSFDNLYFEVTNEPYQGTVTREFEDLMVQAIVETEAGLPNRHLISKNVANRSKVIEDPNPLVSIWNFHYAAPPETVAMNAHVHGVIGDNETGFKGRDDVLYRTEGWAFLMAGGGLYSSLDYSFTPAHPDGTFLDYESPGGGSPALRAQLGILRRVLEGFDFVRMAPDRGVVGEVPEGLEAWALAEPGRQYAVYVLELGARRTARLDPPVTGEDARPARSVRLTLDLPAGAYRAEWVDTRTGEVAKGEDVDHGGGPRAFLSPPFHEDVALAVRAPVAGGRSHTMGAARCHPRVTGVEDARPRGGRIDTRGPGLDGSAGSTCAVGLTPRESRSTKTIETTTEEERCVS